MKIAVGSTITLKADDGMGYARRGTYVVEHVGKREAAIRSADGNGCTIKLSQIAALTD